MSQYLNLNYLLLAATKNTNKSILNCNVVKHVKFYKQLYLKVVQIKMLREAINLFKEEIQYLILIQGYILKIRSCRYLNFLWTKKVPDSKKYSILKCMLTKRTKMGHNLVLIPCLDIANLISLSTLAKIKK